MKQLKFVIFSIFILSCLSIRQTPNAANSNLPSIKCIDDDHVIEITGRAEVTLPNDIIRLGFSVETKDDNSKLSFRKNNEISLQVHELLSQLNIPEKNITTTDFKMYTKYINVKNQTDNSLYYEKFDGFVVKNSIDVKLSDKKTAVELISKLVKKGVEKIDYINFQVEPEKVIEARKMLLAQSALDALEKAKLIVKPLQLNIVDVKKIIRLDYRPTSSVHNYSRMMAASSESSPIYSGERKINVMTQVTFIVKKEGNN